MPSSKGSSGSKIFSNNMTITYMSKPEPILIYITTDPRSTGIQMWLKPYIESIY